MLTNAILRLALGATLILGGLAAQASDRQTGEPETGLWSLNLTYRGDSFNLDQNLTLGDCFDALPQNQTAKGLSFACDRQP